MCRAFHIAALTILFDKHVPNLKAGEISLTIYPSFLLPALPNPRAPLPPKSSFLARVIYAIKGFPSSLKALLHNFLVHFVSPSPVEFSLNPGPWNIKEHVLVFIMANVCVGNPYALNAIVVAEHYYGLEVGYWFSVVLVLATQMTGFGLAGLTRRFLVWPASMVWTGRACRWPQCGPTAPRSGSSWTRRPSIADKAEQSRS